jgi:nitroimidazol reductase NimA-like FMN-containing flavoprotein (pyridoxamine 5'-phosphate oxidase superfamily)
MAEAPPPVDREERTVHELDRDECLSLLATQSLGRLAVAAPGKAPHVVPVNYALHDGAVVFRSGEGTKLTLMRTEPVSFQVDCADPYHRTGWSVLVTGRAVEADPVAMEDEAYVEAFVPNDKPYWIRLVPEMITGRRIQLPAVPVYDPRGYL